MGRQGRLLPFWMIKWKMLIFCYCQHGNQGRNKTSKEQGMALLILTESYSGFCFLTLIQNVQIPSMSIFQLPAASGRLLVHAINCYKVQSSYNII